MIAFAGGADLFRLGDDLEDTFLSKASQRSLANPNPITGAALTLIWRDGTIDSLSIPPNLRHGRQEERVKYLPQKFVELLCAPENNRQLEEEIERVVFHAHQQDGTHGSVEFQRVAPSLHRCFTS